MDLKIRYRLLKNELSSYYKNKVFITILSLITLIILFVPQEFVFSERMLTLGFVDVFLVKVFVAIVTVIFILINILLIRKLKDIWDSLF